MRNRNLDNAKWILTLLMVLYHIQFAGDEKYYFSFMLIKNFGDCVVPAFAIISGFLFWSTVRTFDDIKGKYRRRVYSLLIPYVLWNLINTLYLNFRGGEWGISLFELNIWNDIIMWNSSPHFWYLFMLMFWTILSPILWLLYRKKGGVIVLFVTTVAYLIYKGDNVLHSRFIYIIHLWSGLLGFYYPDFLDKICYEGKKRKRILCILIFLYLAIYFIYCFDSIGMGLKVWLYGIRGVFLLIVLLNIRFEKIGLLSGFRYSFWIFSVHFWLDSYVGSFVRRFVSNPHLYQLLTWILVVFIGFVSGVIMYKKTPKIFKLLSGR